MKDTVVVFARVPRLGAVKRRLARDIGNRAALRFHVATMTRLVRALAADRRVRTVLAVTPDHARFRLPARVPRLAQGCGDLGVRMHRVFWRFRHGRVAIIGCDIPDAGPLDRTCSLPRPWQRRGRLWPGGRRRLLAGGDVAAPSRATVRRGALVQRVRAGRHAGQLRRPTHRPAAHPARRGRRRGLAQVALGGTTF